MPLQPGSSNQVVGQNIKTEEAAGRPPAQAQAIAMNQAGKGKDKKGGKEKRKNPLIDKLQGK